MLNGRHDCARGSCTFFRLEVRIHRIQLLYLGVGSPTQIAVPGVSPIQASNLIEPTCRVEARRKLTGERLVMNKAVCMRRTDGLFVKVHDIERAAFDSG